jgi:hypothetical protein
MPVRHPAAYRKNESQAMLRKLALVDAEASVDWQVLE